MAHLAGPLTVFQDQGRAGVPKTFNGTETFSADATYTGQTVDPDDDRVSRARGGDVSAFEALLAGLVDPGYRVAMAMLHDKGLAEDAVQEASVKAWQKFKQFNPELPLKPWFLGIVANQCRTTARKRWMRELTFRVERTRTWALDDEVLDRLEVLRTLGALPHDQRAAVILHYYLDLPLEQVAATMGWTLPSVKARLHRATTKLRSALQEVEVPA